MNRRSSAKGRRDSDRCLIVTRTVNFNLEDEFQRRIYEATLNWTNFSGRIKRLLESEIVGVAIELPITISRVEETDLSQQEDEYNPVQHLFGRVV